MTALAARPRVVVAPGPKRVTLTEAEFVARYLTPDAPDEESTWCECGRWDGGCTTCRAALADDHETYQSLRAWGEANR